MNVGDNPIRILTVDDHPLFRNGIAALLATQADMTLVAEASNGREAIQQFRAHRPDVTLMDLQMPEMNGLDALMAIRGEFPEARVIMLTTYSGDVQVMRSMQVGARAYLLKNLLDKELLGTIRAVHAGKKALSAEASRFRLGTDFEGRLRSFSNHYALLEGRVRTSVKESVKG